MPGPKNATTDEATGLRKYVWKGRPLTSVTSQRRIIGLPFELHQWTISQLLEAVVARRDDIAGLPDPTDPTFDKACAALKTVIRREATAKRDKAASIGTAVHDAAAAAVPPGKADPEIAPFLRQYLDAVKVLNIQFKLVERQVWNLTQGYAGSLDWVAEVTPPGETTRLALGDIKTGNGVYLDHILQLHAYASAEFVGEDDVTDLPGTRVLHEVDTLGILHVRPDHWEWMEVDARDSTFLALRRLVGVAGWMEANADVQGHIRLRISGAGKGS